MTTKHRTLLNLFHPDFKQSRGNKIIVETLRRDCQLKFVDQYAQYPNFQIDVKKEQQMLQMHDLIIWQFPFYWFAPPALLKQWQDSVLTRGFAYPPQQGKQLHGKALLCIVTTGGTEQSYRSGEYNNFTLSELLRPLQQSAVLCGMKWLSPKVIGGVLPMDQTEIKAGSNQQINTFAKQTADFINQYQINQQPPRRPLDSPYFDE